MFVFFKQTPFEYGAINFRSDNRMQWSFKIQYKILPYKQPKGYDGKPLIYSIKKHS